MSETENPILEAAFLGAVLADNEVLEDVRFLLVPEDFGEVKHAHVWRAILECAEKGLPVDSLHVPEAMKAAGVLMACGGPGWVMALGIGPDGKPPVRFAREVRADARALVDIALRRRIVRLNEESAARAKDPSVPLDTVLTSGADAWNVMHRAAPHLREGQDLFRQVVEEVDAGASGVLTTCIPTGIEAIDKEIAGMAIGELTFFLSLPGVGKSTIFGSTVRNMAKKAARDALLSAAAVRDGAAPLPVDDVGIFSMEDLATWLPRRMLAEASDIPLFVLQKGFSRTPFTEAQMQRFGDAAGEVYELSEHYVADERNMLTVDQIIQSAREMKRQRERMGRRIRVMVLDHIGKVDHQISKHGGKEDLAIEYTLNRLSQFGKQEGIAWAIAVHGNDRSEGAKYKKPHLNSAARTAYFERDARIMLGFYLDKDDDSVILGTVIKQTNGPPDGDFALHRNKNAAMVYNREEDARYGSER